MTAALAMRALVPMKPAQEAKTRLAPVLDGEGRAALALLLLHHVLQALGRSATSLDIWVLGGDEPVRRLAAEESARWTPDPGGGLNAALGAAAAQAFQAGVAAVLVLPGDLGLLTPQDIDGLVTASQGGRKVVLARAASDGGTNALLAPRAFPVRWRFGPDSFQRHREAAGEAGAPVAVCDSAGLGFDLDTPEDFQSYRQARPDLDGALEIWRRRLRGPSPAAARQPPLPRGEP